MLCKFMSSCIRMQVHMRMYLCTYLCLCVRACMPEQVCVCCVRARGCLARSNSGLQERNALGMLLLHLLVQHRLLRHADVT